MTTAVIVAWLLAHAECRIVDSHREVCRTQIDTTACYIDKRDGVIEDVNCFYHGGAK